MKMTLLEMVQDIMSDMDADEVNSINDTVESLQVAQILKSTYFEMVSNRNWRDMDKLIQLEGLNDSAIPNIMRVPATVTEMHWLKYNKRREDDDKDRFESVRYLTTNAFVTKVNRRDENQTNVIEVAEPDSGILLKIRNDIPPEWWTSFNDLEVVFDAFDITQGATMTDGNSQAWVNSEPIWTATDNFIPFFPVDAFSALLAEAKSICFARIKQQPDAKAEQQATRQQRWLSRRQWVTNGGVQYPHYGRRTKDRRTSRLIDKDATNDTVLPPPTFHP